MKLTLAKTYDPFSHDPTGWLMSEKLDGVRAIWDGSRLVSRNGNPFPAPAEWLAQLPAIPLDGELWISRGQFQATLSAAKSGDFSRVRFMVFDAPGIAGNFHENFADCFAGNPICGPVAHVPCRGKAHLEAFMAEILADGGEGIMIRNPLASYRQGRTGDLLKYKPADDSEGILIGTEPGEGRLSGMVGALVLKWGRKTLRIGSGLDDSIRRTPPPRGSKITFGFCGLTDSGLPRFPVFHAVRNYE